MASWSNDHQWTNECLLQFPTCSRTTFFPFQPLQVASYCFHFSNIGHDLQKSKLIVRYTSCMQYDPSWMHHQPLGSTLQLNFKFYKKTMVFMSNILKYLINQFLYKECNIHFFFIVSNHVLLQLHRSFKINQWHIHHSLIWLSY